MNITRNQDNINKKKVAFAELKKLGRCPSLFHDFFMNSGDLNLGC